MIDQDQFTFNPEISQTLIDQD